MSLSIKLHAATSQLNYLNRHHAKNNNTSTLAKFHSTNKIRTKPIYTPNPLIMTTSRSRIMSLVHGHGTSYSAPIIKSSLIEPDGGSLVDLVVPESQRGPKMLEAESLPKIKLTRIDVEWMHVISEGWASPLRGFMREDEYLQSLHFNALRMKDGSVVNMSLPIVLAIDDETKGRIGSSSNVGLLGPNGDCLAILRRSLSSHIFFFHHFVHACAFKIFFFWEKPQMANYLNRMKVFYQKGNE